MQVDFEIKKASKAKTKLNLKRVYLKTTKIL